MFIEVQEAKKILVLAALIMPRLMTAFAIVPFFSRQLFPGLARNSILLSFVLIIYPIVEPMAPDTPLGGVEFLGLVFKEVCIGMFLGFLIGIPFWSAEGVGYLVDQQRGIGMASVVDPVAGEQTSPLGSLLLQVTIVLFFSIGGFLLLLSGIFESYRIWPVFSFFPCLRFDLATAFLGKGDELMALILLLAAPIVIGLFVTEFGMGLISRFAPQLNVFSLAMPVKSAVGGLILLYYISVFLTFMKGYFFKASDIFHFLEGIFR